MVMVSECVLSVRSFDFSFDSFVSRCSITNTEVQLDHVAADDEVREDMSTNEMECPVSVVQLNSEMLQINSEMLQMDSLTLLTEGTFVDSLLTTIPVRVIASWIPSHFYLHLNFFPLLKALVFISHVILLHSLLP